MFAIWLLSSAIANFFAGITGSYIDPVVQDYGMVSFLICNYTHNCRLVDDFF